LQLSERTLKIVWLIFASFLAKVMVEVFEGNQFLVAFLITGHVEEVYISLLWPYESSYVIADIKGFPANLFFGSC